MERLDYFRSPEWRFSKRPLFRERASDRDQGARLAALWAIWRFAAIEVEIAFDQWCQAPKGDNGRAYAVYLDSLRREGEAAERLAERYGCALRIPA